MNSIATKIGLLIVTCILVTIGFMYALTDFLYERLYVADTEVALIEIGTKLQSRYIDGPVTDEYVADVEAYNVYSNYNIFAVRNPKELSACVPFDIDYDTLIGPEQRKLLIEGKHFTEIGYVERFDRDLITVVMPLVDDKRLEGILYMYYPLAKITEFATGDFFYLAISAVVFTGLIALLCLIILRQILKPMRALLDAVHQMSAGKYDTRVTVRSGDEVGQLSQAFNEMATSIQQQDDAQKTFLATVSHELRTPISYVKGYSDLLQKGYVPKEQQQEMLQLIAREATRMEQLTTAIMQLVRREQQPLSLGVVIVGELLREVAQLLHLKLEQKQLYIVWLLDETLLIHADESRVKQLLINVIENAILYSEPKKPITIVADVDGKFAHIQIRDEGIGIPAEDLPHVTERFYRVNKARTRSDGGSGLGLAIVAQFIEEHKGTLSFESTPYYGTTVHIRLPLHEAFEQHDV